MTVNTSGCTLENRGTRNDTSVSINFTAVEGGDNSSYAWSEAREVFINTSSDISGVNK